MLKKIAILMESIAIGIILLKGIWFALVGDYTAEAVSKFIADILTFGVNESIPLEVTLIQLFGIVGAVILVVDALMDRGN